MSKFTVKDFRELPPEKAKEILSGLSKTQLEELRYDWNFWGRPEQHEPKGNWKIWIPLAGRGWGKDIVKTEDILTANKGWIKLSEIEVGDIVFAWDGSYTRVINFYDPEPRQLAKFTFSDGIEIISSVEHDWVTQTRRERKKGISLGSKKTTQEIINSFVVGKRKDKNHSVILAKPLVGNGSFADPYYLGYWLGDGLSSSFNSIAVGEEDREWVKKQWPDLDYIGNCIMRSPTGSRDFMKGYNLSGNKHLPRFVFSLTYEQRLEVLRGLMDSDGYCGKSHVEFCTTSKGIANGVLELVRGLGQKPRLLTGKATLNGVVVSDKYRIKWKPSQGINPFKLPRKADKVSFCGSQDTRNQHRMIVSYEYVEYEPTRCIEVDHPDHVFLVGKGLVPTHNTRCGAEWVRHRIKSGDGRIACVAPTKGDVRRVMVEGESGLLNICWKGDKTYRGADMGFPVWSPTNNTISWANGAKAEFFSAEDPERLRGPQFHSAWCFIEGTQVVTDAGEKDVKTLQVGQRVLTSKGFKRILATSQRPSIVGTVKFSNGKELTGTYEHPIWTNRGWVKLGELKEKDIVCAINVLNGTVSGGIATMTDTTNTEEQDQKVVKIGKDCTGQFTKITTEKFQKVSTYITKMMIKLTTTFQTLNSYRGRNICATTEKSLPSQGQILSQCGTKQAAKTVVMWLKEKLLLKKSSANSVSSKGQTTSVKLLESARIAEKPLCLFEETSVVNVVSTWEEKTEQVVYNIQVEECHEYFANGILTHNCDEICLISSSYIETDSGLKKINTVTKKDKVLTRFGYKQVLDAWHTGKRDTWKITTKTGKTLQGTFDHPVMTQGGWKSLGKLQVGESILVLSGMADAGIKPNAITSTEQVSYSTEKSTNLPMGLFQKVSIFTTSMKIKGAMTWKILKHFLSQNTLQSIQKEDLCKTLTQGSGQGHSGITKNLKSSFARSVAHVLNQLAQEQDFAVNHVRIDIITNVEKASREDVYNITVKDCHEYFANGILNHNCAWTRMEETWDMLQFTLRLGRNPRILVTTTPKPVKLLRNILKPENIESGRVYKTSGSSYENKDNINLEALSQYEGTRLGRQELYAEILDEAAGALWNRKMIDDAQFELPTESIIKEDDGSINYRESVKEFAKNLVKVVVSVDPAITANEESDLTGIIVAGMDINGNAYILEDATDMYMPEQWAAKAISLYNEYEADQIVAERNQGGEMVRSTLRTVDDSVPIKMVHASRGKFARAEPVSSLYERGKVKHVKYLESLEEQMVTWEPLGSIGSPDRLDAMVWAVTNLLLKGYAQPPVNLSYKTINF